MKTLALALSLLTAGFALAASLHATPPVSVAVAADAIHEAKVVGGLAVRVTLEDVTADTAVAVVRVDARRDSPAAVLAVSSDPGVDLGGVAHWHQPALIHGHHAVYRVPLHRASQDGVGRRVFATITADTATGLVGEGAVAWVFGPVDPARALPRSSTSLGPNGVGAIGPNDRVIRTPAGERLHETQVP